MDKHNTHAHGVRKLYYQQQCALDIPEERLYQVGVKDGDLTALHRAGTADVIAHCAAEALAGARFLFLTYYLDHCFFF